MRKFELVIKNADGSVYWTEGFDSRLDLNTWLKEEKSRPYWKKNFVVEELDNSKAVEKAEAATEAARAAFEEKAKLTREEIKAMVQKKPKTVAEAVALLEKIVEHLGLNT